MKLLSTYHDPQIAQFAAFDATSAATAQAAWMAARIQSTYPDAWPETVRGLIVHAAEWTETQRRKYLRDESKGSYYQLTKMCGYGVPHLERALSCASNSLSLIAQAAIQPFAKNEEGRYVSKDMHIYELPWPVDVLRDLGEMRVRMRVTLSYFVEPSPGEVGWKDRYRYASHGLRFALNGPGQSYEEFVKHVNSKAREDEGYQTTEGASHHWQIGESRNVGSIHSDTWSGTACRTCAYPASSPFILQLVGGVNDTTSENSTKKPDIPSSYHSPCPDKKLISTPRWPFDWACRYQFQSRLQPDDNLPAH